MTFQYDLRKVCLFYHTKGCSYDEEFMNSHEVEGLKLIYPGEFLRFLNNANNTKVISRAIKSPLWDTVG